LLIGWKQPGRRARVTAALLGFVVISLPASLLAWQAHTLALSKALLAAIHRNNTGSVLSLLSAGADPKRREAVGPPISVWKATCDWLLRRSSSPNRGRTPLLILCDGKLDDNAGTVTPPENLMIANALIDYGADMNVRNVEWETPLFLCVQWHKTATANLL